MTWTNARPAPKTHSKGPAVRASVRVTKAGYKLAIMMNAEAQDQLFGQRLEGKAFAIEVGSGETDGKLRIRLVPNGEFAPIRRAKGTVQFEVATWAPHLREVHMAEVCDAVVDTGGGVVVTLPQWAQKTAARAKMDAEFGLGKVKREG